MSINLKAGGIDHTIPGEGAIDTREEAEAALTFLPEGSADTVVVGSDSYTRDQLLKIRDSSAAPAGAQMGQGEGVSHGVGIEGHGTAGLGSVGHGGGGASLTYRPGIPLIKGEGTRLHLDPVVGANIGRASKDFKTPGGEGVKSAFTNYGGTLGADLRVVPSFLDHRVFATLGLRLGIDAFSTADSTKVSTPGKCTPGEFGRAECEPSAGARSGNAGTSGLWNSDLGAARGTSGAALTFGIPVTLGVTVLRDSWGAVDLFGGPTFDYTTLLTSNGPGLHYWGVGGEGGAVVRFGGSDAYIPLAPTDKKPIATPPPPPSDKDGDGVPDSEDKCPDVKGTKENAGCAELKAGVTSSPESVKAQEKFLVGLSADSAVKVRVAFKDEKGTLNNSNSVLIDEGNSKSEFSVPAELKSGKYKLVVTFEDMTTHAKKVEEKDIVIVENVAASLPGSFAPGQPPTLQNVRVNGMDKLEGVTYVIEGFDKDKKSVGTLDSNSIPKGDRNWTLNEKQGTRIPLGAPGTKGFQKEINYVVTLKNKEGLPVWTGTFEVGQAAAGVRKRGAK